MLSEQFAEGRSFIPRAAWSVECGFFSALQLRRRLPDLEGYPLRDARFPGGGRHAGRPATQPADGWALGGSAAR
jgi:hypothetical protein